MSRIIKIVFLLSVLIFGILLSTIYYLSLNITQGSGEISHGHSETVSSTRDEEEKAVNTREVNGTLINIEEFYVRNPLTGDEQYVKYLYTTDGRPILIMVPGRGGSLESFERDHSCEYAVLKGFNVIIFDPLGRGRSGGEVNDYGLLDQAILYQLYLMAKERGNGEVGVLSFSYGVTLVSGALANYNMPIELWIDWEGPCDRIFSQCYCGEFESKEAFRHASLEELDTARRRIEENLRRGVKGEPGSCYDNEYWQNREALRSIERISRDEVGLYVRLQGDMDHVQPSYDHTIMMVNRMVELGFKTRLNYAPLGMHYTRENITTYLYPSKEFERSAHFRAINIAYMEMLQPISKYTIYVCIVMHNEDPPTNPDFASNRTEYLRSREMLVKFTNLIHNYGAAFDWQSEWNFLEAVWRYDKGDVTLSTNGLNIVQYLSSLDISVDPHSHERVYNYADVAELIRRLGVEPSDVVGGFLYYPPDNRQGWEKFQMEICGAIYTDKCWKGNILWGASTAGHRGPDCFASGIWKPKDRYHFLTHDASQTLIYVGSYRRSLSILGGLPELIRLFEEGTIDRTKMYTVTIFVSQQTISDDLLRFLESNVLKPITQYVSEGKVEWATLPEMVQIWREEFNSEPNIFIPEDQAEIMNNLFPEG